MDAMYFDLIRPGCKNNHAFKQSTRRADFVHAVRKNTIHNANKE